MRFLITIALVFMLHSLDVSRGFITIVSHFF